jgi:5-epimerase
VLPGTVAGQAKYVTCPAGRALDVLVDLRVGSPTFGAVDAVELNRTNRRAVWIPEGIGHAFVALEDDTTLLYLCSSTYDPEHDRTITPRDPALALPLPAGLPVSLSPKDEAGPTLAEAQDQGLLPRYADCQALYRSLAA